MDQTALTYLDFELQIDHGHEREYPVVLVSSPAGEAQGTMVFPFHEPALENHLEKLRTALLHTRGRRRAALSPEERAVRNFGYATFDALLTGDLRNLYYESQREAARKGKSLRLKLCIQPLELAVLPWEFLFDPRQDEYVCLSRATPIVRYIQLPRVVQPLTVTPPLRVLGMIASPSDLKPVDVDREKERLERAIGDLRASGLVALHWLGGQNWRDLQRVMRRGPHVFHFIGHGGFDLDAGEGFLALVDDVGETNRLSASLLGRLLADHHLRLVLLNTCDGARSNKRDVFSSTASTLVRQGVPAVLAMQHEMTDQAAFELARAFYTTLVDGLSVDAATCEARKAISLAERDTLGWGSPVLTMHSPDGLLFRFQETKPGDRHQTQPIRLSSGWQARSLPYWVKLAEHHWDEAAELLYNGALEEWLVDIDQEKIARKAEQIRNTEAEPWIGLEKFLRSTGLVKRQDRRDVETNLGDIMRQLHYSELRDVKSSKTFSLQISHLGRGYLHGTVRSNARWLDVSKPRFGCLPGQSIAVDVVFVPDRFSYWRPSLKKPLDLYLE